MKRQTRHGSGGSRPMRLLLACCAAAMLLLGGACSSIDCPVENTVNTVYGLRKADGSPDTLRDTLTIVTTRRDGNDSVLLNRSIHTTGFTLPISYNAAEDTLVFIVSDTTGQTLTDVVRIAKNDYPHFESVDCAASFFHYITDVFHTTNAIDSIVINKAHVDYDPTTEHLHIYFKARR